jgi:lipopolysaccharide transport system permease protein
MLIILMVYYKIYPSTQIIILPILVVIMSIYTLGLSLLFSALSVQYRDVTHALSYFNQLLIYATPIIWPVSYIPDDLRVLYGLYPMGGVIEGFRVCLLGGKDVPWDMIIPGMFSSLLILILGLYVFRKMENIFSDVI